MTILGNILIAISTIIYFIILSILFGKTPPKSGDAVMGYAWGVIILNLLFLAGIILIACIIGWKGGFSWVANSSGKRFLIVTIGLLCSVVTVALAGLFKFEINNGPQILRIGTSVVPAIIPILLLGAAFILNNENIGRSVPAAYYQWPLLIAMVTGIIGVTISFGLWLIEYNRNQQAIAASNVQQYDENQQRMLREIDSCDVTKNSVFIYVFCDANQTAAVKEKAVAKVKTNPDWQGELVRRLENDWAPEAFNFLASNEVDSPALFKEAIPKGILIQARLIRETIRKSSHQSHFYPGLFSWEVERVLRTADRFKDQGFNLMPAIKELRAALDEPSEYKKIEFAYISFFDKWIKDHS